MPEQQSNRGQVITTANFEAPFATEIYPFGVGGLNLMDRLDAIPVGEFARLTNFISNGDHGIEVRAGLNPIATVGTEHHSMRRLNDPQAGTYTRIWGVDQSLYIGQSGVPTLIDTGYSGDPLYFLPHRPPLSGDPWMFVADRSRMRKVRADGLDLPIGLPAPGAAVAAALGVEQQTRIASFDQSRWVDGTQVENWTPNAGFDASDPPLITGIPVGSGTEFITNPGTAVEQALKGYNSWWGLPKAMNLNLVGARTATDDDLIHTFIKFTHAHLTAEVRFYFVCSAAFDPTILPGTDASANGDFYVKTFRPSDYTHFIQGTQISTDAAEISRVQAIRQTGLKNQSEAAGYTVVRDGQVVRVSKKWLEERDPVRNVTTVGGGAAGEFIELGIIGVPLRRGEWKRFGTTTGRDWSTITGMVVYIQTTPETGGPIGFDFVEMYLTGGSGPDTAEPGDQSYDYRYTHYDPRTGAEGNPSPVMATTSYLDSLRRDIVLTPVAYGDGAVRQRFYRRGGSLIEDWYFLGANTGDGSQYTDQLTDDAIVSAGTVNLDHYQPVPTVDDAGNTVLNQAVPVLFGPANGLLFALGDPYRPGHLYWCIPDQPDHWPAESNTEVCPPSEELIAGFMAGSQPYCFSRERLYAIYPNLSGTTEVTVTTTACKRGIVSRHAWAVGLGGIYGVSRDGIFLTQGGGEEIISQQIFRLFEDQVWNGYAPVDLDFRDVIRLSISQDVLYFQYQGTDGNRAVIAYDIVTKGWFHYDFAVETSYVIADEDAREPNVFIGGKTSGKSYVHEGFSDDGVAINFTLRTGTWNLGRPREDKLLGDQILDADLQGLANVALQNRLNDESVVNGAQTLDAGTGRQRFILDSFGTIPQRARNISTNLSGSSATARPVFYFLGQSVIAEPDQTINRVTQWDDLGHPDESYVTGITLDCDTGGESYLVHVERDFDGVTSLIQDITVTCDGRHKRKFSWPALPANKVRLRPENECKAWILYKADWIAVPEPPRIARHDIHFEADGDQYYTGLDLYVHTFGLEKRYEVYVDNVRLNNTLAGLPYWPVTTQGREWVHFTLPWGRGHVFHLVAIDDNVGLLYKHKWYVDPEPSEQANWNQNFSIYGSRADKWLKAIIFECDTFGQAKSVQVEVDGAVVETLQVVASGRSVVQLTLTQQQLGRVWRMFPVDGNPGRLYSAQPVFDEEPFKLKRWETQETDHDQIGFQTPLQGMITLKSDEDVTLRLTIYVNQTGTVLFEDYVIPATGGIKDKRFVPFKARKGVLFKYLLTSPSPFFLYQEESNILVLPWGSDQALMVHPFGNADADRTRNMTISALAAARSGGGTT